VLQEGARVVEEEEEEEQQQEEFNNTVTQTKSRRMYG
jgi:hypothetical protein